MAGKIVHGYAYKHKRLYRIWRHMRLRCTDPANDAYKDYGGRGIRVCEAWQDMGTFYTWAINNGYDASLILDRRDNDGPYSPENCRWVSYTQSNNNRRDNRLITWQGTTRTVAEWAHHLGVNQRMLHSRLLRHGADIEWVLSTPTFYRYSSVTYQGETRTLTAWARHLGLPEATIRARVMRLGWSIEKALSTPIHHAKGRRR